METMLANSAPPAKDTTLEVRCGVMPTPVTCTATVQVMAAAMSCRSATRLVERCTAVAELEQSGDQIDHDGREQFVAVMQFRALDVTDEKAEIQRGRQNDEKPEDNLFQIHAGLPVRR
jgi:hypothetical protein